MEETTAKEGRDAAQGVDAERAKLESEKLRLELHRLQHPTRTSLKEFAWKDITTLVALAVAAVGILIGWMTGLFNVQQERLAVTTERLRIDEKRLEQGNAELAKTKSDLETDSQRLEQQIRVLKGQVGSYEKEREAFKAILRVGRDLLTFA